MNTIWEQNTGTTVLLCICLWVQQGRSPPFKAQHGITHWISDLEPFLSHPLRNCNFYKMWNHLQPQLGAQHKITTQFGPAVSFFLLRSRTGGAGRITIVPWQSRVGEETCTTSLLELFFQIQYTAKNKQEENQEKGVAHELYLNYTELLRMYFSFCFLVQALLKPSLLMEYLWWVSCFVIFLVLLPYFFHLTHSRPANIPFEWAKPALKQSDFLLHDLPHNTSLWMALVERLQLEHQGDPPCQQPSGVAKATHGSGLGLRHGCSSELSLGHHSSRIPVLPKRRGLSCPRHMSFPAVITALCTQGLSDHTICSFISFVFSFFFFVEISPVHLCWDPGSAVFHFALTFSLLQALFIHAAPTALPWLCPVSQRLLLF